MASQALAANGAKVYIAGRRLEALKTAAEAHGKENVEGELIPIQMDETDIESVKKAYEEISGKEDRLNLLVNNAGLAGPRADISAAEKGPEAFKEAMLKLPKSAWNDVVGLLLPQTSVHCIADTSLFIQYNTNVYGYYVGCYK